MTVDDRASTLITSQLHVSLWHDSIGDETLGGDAILDRLLHNALIEASMRKNKTHNNGKKGKLALYLF